MSRQDPTSAFLKVIRGEAPVPRPRRQRARITLDLDADILAYFDEGNPNSADAMARIHRVLRAHVDAGRG